MLFTRCSIHTETNRYLTTDLTTYSELNRRRKEHKKSQSRRTRHNKAYSTKQSDTKESSVAKDNTRRKSVTNLGPQTPVNKLMTSSWKYDYKTTAWQEFMNKTGENKEEYNKIGHYRRRQDRKVNVKQGASALDSVDAIFKGVLEAPKGKLPPLLLDLEDLARYNHNDQNKSMVEDKIYISDIDITNKYIRPNSSSITGCQRKHNQKNTMTNFLFRYPDLEISKDALTPSAPVAKEKKLTVVEINKNKHDD